MTFQKRYRPERDYALAEVARVNAIKRDSSNLSGSDSAAISLTDRLREASMPSQDGKPVVVLYTAEFATDKKGKGTRAAAISQKIYDKMIHPVDNRQACFYARFAHTLKIDVSKVAPSQGKLINNKTAPLMLFYAMDGTYSSHIDARLINERSFCKAIQKTLPGNTAQLARNAREYMNDLNSLEALARSQYLTDDKLATARAKIQQAKKRKRRSSSQATSTTEKRVESLAAKSGILADKIATMKERLSVAKGS